MGLGLRVGGGKDPLEGGKEGEGALMRGEMEEGGKRVSFVSNGTKRLCSR